MIVFNFSENNYIQEILLKTSRNKNITVKIV